MSQKLLDRIAKREAGLVARKAKKAAPKKATKPVADQPALEAEGTGAQPA
jgi:hypothetical protein